jgi:NitT/TauT family transport system ATP-binding protein
MIVGGLKEATSGDVVIDGRKVTKPQTGCGVVFQSPLLLDWRDTVGNIMLQVEARPLNRRMYREKCLQLLKSVGLRGFEKKYPRELSGGMQQRVAICRSLIHDPPFLLMDEPFGALDALTREQMMSDLHKLWFDNRKTVLFVTHSIPEAVFLSDRVVMMTPRPGKVDRIIDINIPHPRRLHVQTTPEFAEYVGEITKIFQAWGVLRED